MMRYVQADGDTFIRHIIDTEPTRFDDRTHCYVRHLTPEQKERFGIHKLMPVTPPYYEQAAQARTEGDAVLKDGKWYVNWIVSDLSPEEASEKQAAQWAVIRSERDRLLTATDWWVTKAAEVGEVLSVDKHTYRQALRDITEQPDPFNITWPTEPGA